MLIFSLLAQRLPTSNDEVVDTVDTRERALALPKKHARHKKAGLYVLDTSTNEPETFSNKDMAV
jgi:hypothetical protein